MCYAIHKHVCACTYMVQHIQTHDEAKPGFHPYWLAVVQVTSTLLNHTSTIPTSITDVHAIHSKITYRHSNTTQDRSVHANFRLPLSTTL